MLLLQGLPLRASSGNRSQISSQPKTEPKLCQSAQMWSNQQGHPRSSPSGEPAHMRLSRCVDCCKPLFNKTWKEKIKGQLKARFQWPSKKREGMHVGRYIVKQRCAECQEPLRCNECTEAFFGNLSPEEIRVFIKALVLYAMKGMCVDCNQDFRFVYAELFDQDTLASVAVKKHWRNHSDLAIDGGTPNAVSEIQALENVPEDRKRDSVDGNELERRGGVVHGDWKKEINDLLSNRFHLVLER